MSEEVMATLPNDYLNEFHENLKEDFGEMYNGWAKKKIKKDVLEYALTKNISIRRVYHD